MNRQEKRELIAKRIAAEFKDGDVVNLGIGLPSLVANYIPEDYDIMLHGENGLAGIGPTPEPGEEDPNLTNASGQPATIIPGGSFFDTAVSFIIVRGGHLDITVLGALQVDSKGNLANWMVPGKLVPGMGGAMDLTVGAKKVIVATEHVTKTGQPKVVGECNLPLTAKGEVNMIVSDMAVMEVTPDGLLLKEIATDTTLEEVKKATGAELIVARDLKTFSL
ncbi:MAG: 3-oxoacid CoA-transferase subunit B [Halanaerobium sp.]|nr:3-oxoacid CoA-transferase subunit B [Halanaerobium sp.]